jgi:hypothetical protein
MIDSIRFVLVTLLMIGFVTSSNASFFGCDKLPCSSGRSMIDLASRLCELIYDATACAPQLQSEPSVEKVKKKKKDQMNHQKSYESNADSRIDDNMREIEKKRRSQQSVSGADRVRSVSIENTDEKKLNRTRDNEKYSRKGDTQVTENKLRIESKKQQTEENKAERSGISRFLKLKFRRDEADRRKRDERRASDQRIENSRLRIERKRSAQQEMRSRSNSGSARNARKIEKRKREIEITKKEKELDSSNNRFDARKEVFEKKKGSQKAEEEFLSVPGTEALKEGVTENSYKLGNKMVTERVVKVGNKVDKYKKVVSKTTIYYFCNDRSITEETWRKATLAR